MKPIWQVFARFHTSAAPDAWVALRHVPADQDRALRILESCIREHQGKLSAICIGHHVARKGMCVRRSTLRTFDTPAPVELRTHATP